MLVRARVLQDRGHVHPALVRERTVADVRHPGERGYVDYLADSLGQRRQRAEVDVSDVRILLQGEVRQDRAQVGVPASLAYAVDGPLNHRASRVHCGEGACGREVRIVVAVNPERDSDGSHNVAHGRGYVPGEGAPVRVAQDKPFRAPTLRSPQGGDGVLAVGTVPVEEVLGIEHHPLAGFDQEPDAVLYHGQVVLQGDPEGIGDLEVP